MAAHLAYDMFSKYKYLIVNFVFPTSIFGVGFFLIAPFPDHCLLVLYYLVNKRINGPVNAHLRSAIYSDPSSCV